MDTRITLLPMTEAYAPGAAGWIRSPSPVKPGAKKPSSGKHAPPLPSMWLQCWGKKWWALRVCSRCWTRGISPISLWRSPAAERVWDGLCSGALIDHCRESGASFLTLEVRQSNAPAIALYESMGFLPEGRRKNFYRQPTEDAILMTKRDLSL